MGRGWSKMSPSQITRSGSWARARSTAASNDLLEVELPLVDPRRRRERVVGAAQVGVADGSYSHADQQTRARDEYQGCGLSLSMCTSAAGTSARSRSTPGARRRRGGRAPAPCGGWLWRGLGRAGCPVSGPLAGPSWWALGGALLGAGGLPAAAPILGAGCVVRTGRRRRPRSSIDCRPGGGSVLHDLAHSGQPGQPGSPGDRSERSVGGGHQDDPGHGSGPLAAGPLRRSAPRPGAGQVGGRGGGRPAGGAGAPLSWCTAGVCAPRVAARGPGGAGGRVVRCLRRRGPPGGWTAPAEWWRAEAEAVFLPAGSGLWRKDRLPWLTPRGAPSGGRPTPAATVVPLRDGEAGLEVLLLRRSAGAPSAACGCSPAGRSTGSTSPPGPAERERPRSEVAAARRAAVREAREEAGARPGQAPGDPLLLAAATRGAPALRDLVLPGAGRRPPAGRRRRAGDPRAPLADAGRRHGGAQPRGDRAGAADLHDPVVAVAAREVAAALAAAASRPPERFMTRMAPVRRPARATLWDGDAGYRDGDLDRPGPRSDCGWTRRAGASSSRSNVPSPWSSPAPLRFDPILEARRQWAAHGWESRRRHGRGHVGVPGPADLPGPHRRRPAAAGADLRPLRGPDAVDVQPGGRPAPQQDGRPAAGPPDQRDQRGRPPGGTGPDATGCRTRATGAPRWPRSRRWAASWPRRRPRRSTQDVFAQPGMEPRRTCDPDRRAAALPPRPATSRGPADRPDREPRTRAESAGSGVQSTSADTLAAAAGRGAGGGGVARTTSA